MIYGVAVYHQEDYTDFMLITAQSEESATDMLNEMGYADFEICDAEDLINSQYDGLTLLSTSG